MSLPIVFIHGWASVPDVWHGLIEKLDHDNVINLALPGYDGAEADWQNPVASILPHIPEQCHLVGWSLGGNLAMEIVKAVPERVASVATIATVPNFVVNSAWPWAMPSELYLSFINGFMAAPLLMLKRFAALQAKGDANARQIAKALLALADESKLHVLQDSLAWLGRTNQSDDWLRVSRPHLAIYGDSDAIVPAAAAEHCQRSVVIPQCGHAPMISHPDELLSALQAFWGSV